MAKRSGLGSYLYAGGYDLSNDIGGISRIATPRGVYDDTGIDKSAKESLLTWTNGQLDVAPIHFNDAADRSHPRFGSLPTTDVITVAALGATAGSPAACMVAKQINYDGVRGADGALSFTTNQTGNGFALEWGELLTAGKVTSTGAESLASLDGAAATSDGLSAYLQVFAFTGTSATITIQESSDDGAGDAWAAVTGGAFTAVTGITSERIVTADPLTVEQYLRVNIAGTYSSLVFAVAVHRRDAAEIL